MRGPQSAAVEAGTDQPKTDQKQQQSIIKVRHRRQQRTTGKTSSMDLVVVVVPFHPTLSPAAAAAAADRCRRRSDDTAAAADAATTAPGRSRSQHGVFQHETVQVRDHRHHDEFQKKPPDQPMPIKIQNQAADHH